MANLAGISNFHKVPELRRRVIFTLGMLAVYRVGVFVTVPGVDRNVMRQTVAKQAGLLSFFNMFSGGALENFSIFALGIMPYISVSIIIQLMTTAIPRLEELSKEGDQGRRVITRYTRIGTILLALFQGSMISIGLEHQGVVTDPGTFFRFKTALTL